MAHLYGVSILNQMLCWQLGMGSEWDTVFAGAEALSSGESHVCDEKVTTAQEQVAMGTHMHPHWRSISPWSCGVNLHIISIGQEPKFISSTLPPYSGLQVPLCPLVSIFSWKEHCLPRKTQKPHRSSPCFSLLFGNICWVIEKARELQKNICFIDYSKAFDCVEHNKLWKILKEMGLPDHLTCLLRNLHTGQEATIKTRYGTTDWFQIGKGIRQGCILSPCLFNLYAEYIIRNAGVDEAQAGIKIAGRNINNLRYVDDTTLMAESEEELKSLLMKVKEESKKVGLKLNIQRTKIMTSGPITSWEIDGETVGTVSDFAFFGLQNHCRWWMQLWN